MENLEIKNKNPDELKEAKISIIPVGNINPGGKMRKLSFRADGGSLD